MIEDALRAANLPQLDFDVVEFEVLQFRLEALFQAVGDDGLRHGGAFLRDGVRPRLLDALAVGCDLLLVLDLVQNGLLVLAEKNPRAQFLRIVVHLLARVGGPAFAQRLDACLDLSRYGPRLGRRRNKSRAIRAEVSVLGERGDNLGAALLVLRDGRADGLRRGLVLQTKLAQRLFNGVGARLERGKGASPAPEFLPKLAKLLLRLRGHEFLELPEAVRHRVVKVLLAEDAHRPVLGDGECLPLVSLLHGIEPRRLPHGLPLLAARSGEHALGERRLAQTLRVLALAAAFLSCGEYGRDFRVRQSRFQSQQVLPKRAHAAGADVELSDQLVGVVGQ